MFSYEIISILFAIGGLYVANRIRTEKKAGRKMVCPLNGNCEQILSSDFSKFAGVPLEIAGIAYYLLIIIAQIALIIFPALQNTVAPILLYGLTFVGFIFSVYLTIIQAFYLKNWCTWCLYSGLFSSLLFIAVTTNFILNFEAFRTLMLNNTWLFIATNLFAYSLGTSLAIVAEIFTFRFLKDFQIDQKEKIHLMYLWQVLWITILLVIISSFAILIFRLDIMSSRKIFELKTIIFSFIVFGSALLSLYILPILNTSKDHCKVMHIVRASWCRVIAISLSTLLLCSWIVNIFVSQIFTTSCSFTKNISLYLIIVFVAIFSVIASFQYRDKKTLDKIKQKSDN